MSNETYTCFRNKRSKLKEIEFISLRLLNSHSRYQVGGSSWAFPGSFPPHLPLNSRHCANKAAHHHHVSLNIICHLYELDLSESI